jgi:hypothetical protein
VREQPVAANPSARQTADETNVRLMTQSLDLGRTFIRRPDRRFGAFFGDNLPSPRINPESILFRG